MLKFHFSAYKDFHALLESLEIAQNILVKPESSDIDSNEDISIYVLSGNFK